MSLEKIITKFENSNEMDDDDFAYGYIKKHNKDDIIKTIRQYHEELFCKTYKNGQYTQLIVRFIKAIQDYIKDEDVLIELFRINGKDTLDAISSNTNLLNKQETAMLVYGAAIKRK